MENLVTLGYDNQTTVGLITIRVCPSWMDPIVSFLKDGTFPDDKAKVEKAQRKVPRYWLLEEWKLHNAYIQDLICYAST